MTWATLDVDHDLDISLIRLNLDLDISYWIRKIPNFATNNINK